MTRVLLIALDSVGIDPLGTNRPESVYAQSRFLFPPGEGPDPLPLPNSPVPGALVETVVAEEDSLGAIECAITYTSIFSGQSALNQHGLMRGIGLKERVLKELIEANNLFERFENPCLVNAIFPVHLAFLGSSYVQGLLPAYEPKDLEAVLHFDGRSVHLKGTNKHGFAELFTLGEINQNIFIYAAQRAGVPLRTWADVRAGQALTGTMTNELEARFNWEALDQAPLPLYRVEEAARILVNLTNQHDFTFYKYQMADWVSHTGKIELARSVFTTIETFVEAVLRAIDPAETTVIITSDHGHLEQVGFTRGHPKSKVPTWYFGANVENQAARMRCPEAIFQVIAEQAPQSARQTQGG